MTRAQQSAEELRGVVSLRPGDSVSMPFVCDSWIKTSRGLPVYEWIGDHRPVSHHIRRLASTAEVLVATTHDDPTAYSAWICYGRGILYFVYVKKDLRRLGLCHLLMTAAFGESNKKSIESPYYKRILYDRYDLVYAPHRLKEIAR